MHPNNENKSHHEVSACELGAAWQVALSLVGLAARESEHGINMN